MIWYMHQASSKRAKHGWLAMDTFYTFRLSTNLKLHCTLWKRERKTRKTRENDEKKTNARDACNAVANLVTMSGTQLPVDTPARGIWSASLRGPKSAGSAAVRPVQHGVQHNEMHIYTKEINYSLTYKRILYWSNIYIYSRHIRVSYNLQIHLAYNICIRYLSTWMFSS